MVVLASAAIAALLSELICILLPYIFRQDEFCAPSASNTVDRLPVGILSLCLFLGPQTPAKNRLLVPELSV